MLIFHVKARLPYRENTREQTDKSWLFRVLSFQVESAKTNTH